MNQEIKELENNNENEEEDDPSEIESISGVSSPSESSSSFSPSSSGVSGAETLSFVDATSNIRLPSDRILMIVGLCVASYNVSFGIKSQRD